MDAQDIQTALLGRLESLREQEFAALADPGEQLSAALAVANPLAGIAAPDMFDPGFVGLVKLADGAIADNWTPAIHGAVEAASQGASVTVEAAGAYEVLLGRLQVDLDGMRQDEISVRADGSSAGTNLKSDAEAVAQLFATVCEQLEQGADAASRQVAQHIRPGLERELDVFAQSVQALAQGTIPSIQAASQASIDATATAFDTLASNAGQQYTATGEKLLAGLQTLMEDEAAQALDRLISRVRQTLVDKVKHEIVEAIVGVEVSVAVSTTLAPVMPQLIAFYKGLQVLEDAIGVFKAARMGL